MPSTPQPRVRLRLRVSAPAESNLRSGHPWLFADSIREQNRKGEPGELAVIYDRRNRFLAVGLYDPDSPICVRILHTGKPQTIDRRWWVTRLEDSVARREGLFDDQTTGYRWINGESDGWPGLVLDRYDQTLVLKLYTAAWLPRLDEIAAIITERLSPDRLVLRLSRNLQPAAAKFKLTDGQTLSSERPSDSPSPDGQSGSDGEGWCQTGRSEGERATPHSALPAAPKSDVGGRTPHSALTHTPHSAPPAAPNPASPGEGVSASCDLTIQRFNAFNDSPPAPPDRPSIQHPESSNSPIFFLESSLHFEADVFRGQKTGFFLDQRENRRRVETLAHGRSVLNAFSFSGGFSLYAARGGATSVTDLDLSRHALESSRRNFTLNHSDARIASCRHELILADAFDWLSANAKRKFDLIILDPPSLAKREAERAGAIRAYTRLAQLGISNLNANGILLACSCSAHVTAEEFFTAVRSAATKSRRAFTELETTHHPPDHPAIFKEAEYLKAIYFRSAP